MRVAEAGAEMLRGHRAEPQRRWHFETAHFVEVGLGRLDGDHQVDDIFGLEVDLDAHIGQVERAVGTEQLLQHGLGGRGRIVHQSLEEIGLVIDAIGECLLGGLRSTEQSGERDGGLEASSRSPETVVSPHRTL